MNCLEKDCNGVIDENENNGIFLHVGCRQTQCAHICKKCGRLHFLKDNAASLVMTRKNVKVFLKNGELVKGEKDVVKTNI